MPAGTGGLLDLSDGGEEEDRTPDLRIANATLSQLSYPPTEAASLANGPPLPRVKHRSTRRTARVAPSRNDAGRMVGRGRYLRTSLLIAWFTRTAQSSAAPAGRVVVHCAPIDAAVAPAFR
jgi:hypothetical protein